MRDSEHAPRDPFHLLERRHGLAEIVERGVGVLVERIRVGGAEPGEKVSKSARRWSKLARRGRFEGESGTSICQAWGAVGAVGAPLRLVWRCKSM